MKYSLLLIVSLILSQLSYTNELASTSTTKTHSMQLKDRRLPQNFAKLIEQQFNTKKISKPTVPLTPKTKAKKIEKIYRGQCHVNLIKKSYGAHLRTKKHRSYDVTESEAYMKSSDTNELKVDAIDEHEAINAAYKQTAPNMASEFKEADNKLYKCKSCLACFEYCYELAEHKIPGHEKSCQVICHLADL